MDSTDILIIGGGLNGLILATGFDQLGYDVALVEARELKVADPSFDTRAIALSKGSVDILKSMNLWKNLSDYACQIDQVHVSEAGGFGFSRIHSSDLEIDYLGQVIEITHLARMLLESLPKRVQQFIPAKFESIDVESNMVSIKQGDQTQTISPKLIIAADGANSPIRSALNLSAEQKDFNHSAIVGNIQLKRSHGNIAYERFTQKGPVALLPVEQDKATFIWTMAPEEVESVMALDDGAFIKKLQDAFGYRAGRFMNVSKRQTYPLKQTVMTEPASQNVLFFGNAAHALHPIAGQGFNLSLRDAAELFDQIKAHGLMHCIEPYLAKRTQDQKRIIQFTDALTMGFSIDLLSAKFLRNSAIHIIERVPPLKKRMGKILAGKSAPLPTLARGLPL